jgi:hypothetical protein
MVKQIDYVSDEHKLAAKKLADKYVGREGEPPWVVGRAKAGRLQDLNDDDRQHLRFCLDVIRKGLMSPIANREGANACLDFVVAVIDRDYNLYRGGPPPA